MCLSFNGYGEYMYKEQIKQLLQAIETGDLETIERLLEQYQDLFDASAEVIVSPSLRRSSKSFFEYAPTITSGLLGIGGGVYSAISIFNGANSVIPNPISMTFVNTLATMSLAGGSYALDAYHVRNKVNDLNRLTSGNHVAPLLKEMLILIMGVVLLAIFNGIAFTYAKDASKIVLNAEAILVGLALGLPMVLRQMFVTRPISEALKKEQIAVEDAALQEQASQFQTAFRLAQAYMARIKQIETLISEKADFKSQLKKIRLELTGITKDLKEKEDKIEGLLEQIVEIQRDIQLKEREIVILKQQDEQNKETIQGLQVEITEKKVLIESLQKTVEELRSENKQLKESVKQAKQTSDQSAATSSTDFFKTAKLDTPQSTSNKIDVNQLTGYQLPQPK